ncbi:MAG: ligand-binding sensor domain-containing protein [Bacteroidota bacterium]
MAILKRFIALILIAIPPMIRAQSPIRGLPFVRYFHTIEYKAGIQNWQIAQDKRGLIYIANNFGLLEYDGNSWHTYRVHNGTKVRSVAIDKRGRIYVGCQGDFGYFFPDERGRLTYTSLADSLKGPLRNFDETWRVYIDHEKVYFCTFTNIYVYDGKKFAVTETHRPVDLSFLVNRQLYIANRADGLSMMEGDQLKQVKGGDHFPGLSVSSVLPLGNDELLISTSQHGVFQLSDGKIKVWNEAQQQLLKTSNVNCMIRLRNGNFAAGTQNSGLLVLDPHGNLVMQLTMGRGLENRTVLSLFEDDLGNIWVGQNNGIAYVESGSPFTFINEQIGLPGTGYSAYLDDDNLYLGTNTGLYLKENNSNFKLVEKTPGQVYHVGKYDGDLLVGHHHGALRVENDQAVPLSPEPGAWIFLQLKNYPDKLIGGAYGGLYIYERGSHWNFRRKLEGFGESSRVMALDQNGDLWVTHGYKGAYHIRLSDRFDSVKHVSFYGSQKGFPSNSLINVFRIRNELLFTSEQGIFKYDPTNDKFKRDDLFTKILGADVQLWCVQEDALGNIYFVGRDHIGMLRKNSIGEYEPELNTFNKIRKFLNDDLINISILKNNEVLFGAKEGFIHFDPKMSPNRKPAFKTIIRNVSTTASKDSILFFGNYIHQDTLTDQQLSHYKPELPYRSNSVNFTFTATSYEGDADLTYQYYLDNYEKGWSAWTPKTQKEYTNLKEGKYTFHVRAKNVNGEISPESVYEFSINPPWYRSIWAYSFYGVSVIALLFTGFNTLDRKYQREQQLMVLRQKKELNRKDNEINKLSQQSQEEINRLQHEKLESELRHMNSELGTSTMHLLNKNEFITGIKTNLTQIIKKSNNEDVKRELVQITKDIENNISADTDWEQFQYHFDRVHGDFSTRFKAAFPALSPQEIKLSAYLRMNLSSKEIAQLLNISIRGVEISRYRLRKKLHLDRNKNLQEFILNF